ncbi:MAG: hypothetical protein ACPG32_03415 [Akkermansiaceae bacterium]
MLRLILLLLVVCQVPSAAQSAPRVKTPTAPPNAFQPIRYPWKKHIQATVFWVGEEPTAKNPTPNHASSWDTQWQKNFGGFDDPNPANRINYRPKAFVPQLNPFYIALPYNDCINHATYKPEAHRVIPWWKRRGDKRPGKTSCKGRWVQIVYGRRVCYAQWEDCGPFTTNDWQYVFGNQRPKNTKNNGAGIDISPSVRDFLGMKSNGKVHWRFIDFARVPRGPWSVYGKNNPFIHRHLDPDHKARMEYMDYLKKLRDEAYRKRMMRK